MDVTARLPRAGVRTASVTCAVLRRAPGAPHAPRHPDGHLADMDTEGRSPGTCLSSFRSPSGGLPNAAPRRVGGPQCSPGHPASSVLTRTFLFPVTPRNWPRAGHPGALGKGGELSPWNEAGLRIRSLRPRKESGYVDATQGHRGRRGLQNKPDTNAARRKDMLPGRRRCGAPREASRGRGAENPVRARPSAGDGASAGCPPHVSRRAGRWLCLCVSNVTKSF